MKITWRIETRNIADLKPYHKNPRKLSKEQYEHLKTSVEKFGLIDKIIVNTDGTIIGGHQRVQVLKKLKHKQVECYVPSDPIEDKDLQELNVRLNKNLGSFDFDILANQWDTQDLLEWGFTADELDFDVTSLDDEAEKEGGKPKKSIMCPSCGHEFS